MIDVRKRFEGALEGKPAVPPVYAVYDWFVKNRPAVDWAMLFELGLGQINHANLIRHTLPHCERVETTTQQGRTVRRDVRLMTDRGELHEWYLGEWRQEHFIKTPEDYRIMKRAIEDVHVVADSGPFLASEAALGGGGITIGQIQGLGSGRTPLMVLQIDWVGLERFSMDLADELPELMDLLEAMTAIKLEEIRQAVRTPASQIKLWENLSIDTIGHRHFRRHLAPIYRDILAMVKGAGKQVQVHYDGRLKVISDDVAALGFDGIDSFTEAPEGDMTVAEARQAWPDKFLWTNVNLNLYSKPPDELAAGVERLVRQAGSSRFCLMISEDVPPNWGASVPVVLKTLEGIG